jgi:hypothetical protein
MKNYIQQVSLLLCLLTLTMFASAQSTEGKEIKQDTIYKVTGDILVCIVSEMNTTEVKYHYPDRLGVTLALDNELIDYIILSSGEILRPQNSDKEISDLAFDKQKRINIKLGILTPLQGYTDLGFEYSIKPMHSIEGSLGIIGLGSKELNIFGSQASDRGATLTAGYKVYARPDFFLRKVRNAHRMSGLYIQPTLAVSYLTSTETVLAYDYDLNKSYNYDAKSSVFQGALLFKMGKQYIFGDIFSLDINAGVGFGMKNVKEIESSNTDIMQYDILYSGSYGNYGFTTFQGGALALSAGLKIGVLIQ